MQPCEIRSLRCSIGLLIVTLVLLAQSAEGKVNDDPAHYWENIEDLVSNYGTGSDESMAPENVLMEEPSEAAEGGMDKLQALEKDWKSKEKMAQKTLAETSLAQHAQLAADLRVEKDAKVKIQKRRVSRSQTKTKPNLGLLAVTAPTAPTAGQPAPAPAPASAPATTPAPAPATTANDHSAELESTKSELAKAQATIASMKKIAEDKKEKHSLEVKALKAKSQQATEKAVASVDKKMRAKVDEANKAVLKEQKREADMVSQVEKDRTAKETAKVKMQDALDRKEAHKSQEMKAAAELKAYKAKYAKEKMLEDKAVLVAKTLGEKIKEMSLFGNKSAALAKAEALKLEQASADAKDKISLIRSQKEQANQAAAELNATNLMLKQQLAEAQAKMAALEAVGLHEKAKRQKVEQVLLGVRTELNHTVHEKLKMHTELLVHKLKEKKASKEAETRKAEEEQALVALKKVDVVKKGLSQCQAEVERYRNENKLQRMELAHAAMQEITAANVTRTAAAHAEAMEQQSLTLRNKYKKWMAKAKGQIQKQHSHLLESKKKYMSLLQKAQKQLQMEHLLRTQAEQQKANATTLLAQVREQASKDHQMMQKTKATADQIAADRDRLSQRAKAASQMIAVEQEATEQAKKAALDLQKADNDKLSQLKASYDKLLRDERIKSDQAQALASTVSNRSAALQDAMAREKALLEDEQEKAAQKEQKWNLALQAFRKERKARMLAKGATDASSQALARKAALQIQKAQQLANDKDALLTQLKGQLKVQAEQCSKAAKDWDKVKRTLMMRVKNAEEDAAEANGRLAAYTEHAQQDAAAASAESAVDEQVKQTESNALDDLPMDVDHGSELELRQDAQSFDNTNSLDFPEDEDDIIPEESFLKDLK